MNIKLKSKNIQLLLAILFISSLISCNLTPGTSKKDAHFASMFPNIKIGEYLKLVTVANGPIPPETRDDYIGIAIINISDQQIILSPYLPNQNYVYIENEEKWIPIPEKLISHGQTITLYPKTDLERERLKEWVGPVSPDLSGYKKPIVVRVVIFGEILQNGESTGQKVGSYIDITFQP